MHIGLLIYGSLETLSGGYLYDRQLVAALQQAGHRVDILSVPWRNYTKHLTDNFSVPLLQQLRSQPFDLLLQDELNHPSLAWLNGRLHPHVTYPIIAIVHHLRSSERHPSALMPLYRGVERRYLQQVDGFILNSNTTRATVQALAPHDKPTIVAFPAADHRQPPPTPMVLEKLQRRATSNEPLQILFVGNLIARKGLHHLLAALAKVPRTLWQLQVVGSLTTDSTYTRQIQRLLHEQDLMNQVHLHGRTDDATLWEIYMRSDLFAAPAYEGFGIAYLEAMSFGLPVLASTIGAAHEIVTHEQNGFLVAPTDIAAMAAYLTRCCEERGQIYTLGTAARARYTSHPTWQASFAPMLEWLQEQVATG